MSSIFLEINLEKKLFRISSFRSNVSATFRCTSFSNDFKRLKGTRKMSFIRKLMNSIKEFQLCRDA